MRIPFRRLVLLLAAASCLVIANAASRESGKTEFLKGLEMLVRGKENKALSLLQKSANKGFADADFQLWECFRYKLAPGLDLESSLSHLYRAADGGCLAAMEALADQYASGEYVPQDDANAFACYLKAAEGGLRSSIEKVITCYQEGRGVEADAEKAQFWLDKKQKRHNGGEIQEGAVLQQPCYPGGEEAMYRWLCNNVIFPQKLAAFHGKVVVKGWFTVEKTGEVTNVKIDNPGDPLFGVEVKRLIHSMPAWQPGTADGKPVNVTYTLPVTFSK